MFGVSSCVHLNKPKSLCQPPKPKKLKCPQARGKPQIHKNQHYTILYYAAPVPRSGNYTILSQFPEGNYSILYHPHPKDFSILYSCKPYYTNPTTTPRLCQRFHPRLLYYTILFYTILYHHTKNTHYTPVSPPHFHVGPSDAIRCRLTHYSQQGIPTIHEKRSFNTRTLRASKGTPRNKQSLRPIPLSYSIVCYCYCISVKCV